MPRFNVRFGEKWACFSTIVDAFITPFMSAHNYDEWRKVAYGREYVPIERANQMLLRDAISNLILNKSDEEIVENLRFSGLFSELPPHGDLIDRDELIDFLRKCEKEIGPDKILDYVTVHDWIEQGFVCNVLDAPVIIPSNKEEQNERST